ncbi:PP2C family protein-serine/threonine phosphatase [Lignipirellula cremea]|uniref:Phosphoserine phosphatase RsbU n=1 Tax=Lignipirellula cremea TaxID=2528010 RepID=A0A518DYC8_9BACT|nr:SpoIIE family protein phosphatase [Lignipirellula cremea]QDU96834.1 Phosphoserine phosphatase RsbU [Lignipirellula cremea]
MSSAAFRLLLFEDNRTDRNLIREWLSDSSVRFDMTCVERLHEGLALLAEAADAFDLLVVDLTLPDSSGLATFEKVHQAAPQLPIVVLSSMADEELAVKAVQLGAEDYLMKGQAYSDWLERSLRYAIERRRMRDAIMAAEAELRTRQEASRVARHIQQQLFPRQAPAFPGFEIAGASFPADETGGDYFDYLPMGDGSYGLVIGDVGGHGIGPALLMAGLHSYLRALLVTHPHLSDTLFATNNLLTEDTQQERLVTLFFVELHPFTRQLRYAAAGQLGLLLRASGEVVELRDDNLPFGVALDCGYSVSDFLQLASGDWLLLYTDGLTERQTLANAAYGEQRLLDFVAEHRRLSAEEMVDAVFGDAMQFSTRKQYDDITLLFTKVL